MGRGMIKKIEKPTPEQLDVYWTYFGEASYKIIELHDEVQLLKDANHRLQESVRTLLLATLRSPGPSDVEKTRDI